MTENPENITPEIDESNGQPEEDENKILKIVAVVLLALVVLSAIVVIALAATGAFSGGEVTPEPTEITEVEIFIEITEPTSGAVLDITQPVTVKGVGGGLFEGNVVVQALDQDGNILAQQPTTIESPDAGTGGEGPWSVQLTINTTPGTSGKITAFSPSAEGGDPMATDSVDVTYGEEEMIEPYITIANPKNGAILNIENPVKVDGTGGGLYEGSVVVQAMDGEGKILAESTTTINAPDAGTGGEGPWSVELSIDTDPGTTGKILAYSPSAEGGDPSASASVDVTYGEIQDVEPYLTIENPVNGAVLNIQNPVPVNGWGGGLHEGNVVVQALDGEGNVLAEQTTTINAPDAGTGGEGPWSVELTINTGPGTTGKIRAFSPSAEGGDPSASASVDVIYGEKQNVEPYISIDNPENGATLNIQNPIAVNGWGGALFEGNVVVQALDGDGNVLAEQPTIIQAPDAGTGGEGPWSVELTVETTPVTSGKIYAYSDSPQDGSIMASASVDVTYGEAPEEEKVNPEDHLWYLVSLDGNPLIEKTAIYLQFEDNNAVGSAGCNNYNSTYELTATTIQFGPPGTTRKSCPTPEGIMDQENQYLAAFESAATYTIENMQFKISNEGGDLILVYDAAVIGNVIGPDGATVPEDSVVQVQLNDVSLADVQAVTIGEQIITGVTEFPFPFVVTYDPEVIEENHTYAIQVRIEDSSGGLIFINTSAYLVITSGHPSLIDVTVEAVN
jgi:uncharacterized lipoprotein YbaY